VEIICCVDDGTPLPIIHTHNGDGTFQNCVLSFTSSVQELIP